MKKLWTRALILACALALLPVGCAALSPRAARAETAAARTADTETILFLICEGTGNSFYPIMPFLLTADRDTGECRFTHFYYMTRIEAVTKKGETVSMPMSFLSYCDTTEIVKAYENTFGIRIDRYLIYKYDYQQVLDLLDTLCPVTVDVPEEFMGDAEYSTINGNMKAFARQFGREAVPLEHAGEQTLDSLGLFSYFHTIPDRVWAGDRFDNLMEDYRLWDQKNRTMIAVFKSLAGLMGEDAVAAAFRLMTDGQDTNLTDGDIAAWSAMIANQPEGMMPYFTFPGYDGVEMQDFNAKALTGTAGYDAKMLACGDETTAEALRAFLSATDE